MLLNEFDDISDFYGINGDSVIIKALRTLDAEIAWAVIQKYYMEQLLSDIICNQ